MVLTYVLEDLDFAQNTRHLVIVLALQLVQHRVAVLPLLVRRCGSVCARGRAAVGIPV